MTVWMFDRGAVYSASAFNVNDDGLKFVGVVLGYLLMNECHLGLDPTVIYDVDGRKQSILIAGERFSLEKLIYHQKGIICRGTTCWKASRANDNKSYVIKDSWQYDGIDDEGTLLAEITKTGTEHVAPCYRHETVQIDSMDDDLIENVRSGIDIKTGTKYRPSRLGSMSPVSFRNPLQSSLRLKRVASESLKDHERTPKRSRSDSQSATMGTMNRRHKRIVMSKAGKKLHLARTRVGVLKALVDAISGTYEWPAPAGIVEADAVDTKHGYIIARG